MRRLAIVLLVVGTALGVRLNYLLELDAYPRFELIKNRLDDQVVFHTWASAIARGELFDPVATGHEFATWAASKPGVFPIAPLYPYSLAAIYRLLGQRFDLVRLLQMLGGTIAVLLVFLMADRVAGRGAACLAGLAVALYGPWVFYELTFLRASPAVLAAALALWLLFATTDEGCSRRRTLALLTGLVLGLGVLLRPNNLLFALGGVGWLWLRRDRSPRRLWLHTLVGLLLMVLPVTALNSVRSGKPAFLSSNGPYIFFIGNAHDATGISAGQPPSYHRLKASGAPESINLLAEAGRDIARHPGAWLRLLLTKLRAFYGAEEIPNNLSFTMARRLNPALRLAPVAFHWLWPAALLGLVVGWPRRGELAPLYILLACSTAGTVLFYVLARLRQPAVVALAVFAAVAAGWWLRQLREGRFRRALLAVIAVLSASILLRPKTEILRPTDYGMAGAAAFSRGEELERAGLPREAHRRYRQALLLNPEHEGALEALRRLEPPAAESPAHAWARRLCEESLAAVEAGRPAEATRLLDEAIRAAPDLALPHQYLANIAIMAGDDQAAMRHTERALELQPLSLLYRLNLIGLRARAASAPPPT